MSTHMGQSGGEDVQAALAPVLRVLSQLGGYFVFTNPQGEQFVVSSKEEFEARREKEKTERQLPLTAVHTTQRPRMDEEEIVDIIASSVDMLNREIALSKEPQDEQIGMDDLGLEIGEEPQVVEDGSLQREYELPSIPPLRVKFEPIRGDLPPELQE